jgi:hypothetical protein
MTSQLLRIPVEIELFYKGRSVKLKGIVDTGAADFLSIAEKAVAPLSLNLYGEHKSSGIVEGASIPAWYADIDRLSVVGNPDCTLDNVKISVNRGFATEGGLENFLLGDDFLRSLNATVEYSEGGAKIICHPKTTSLTPLLVGGAVLGLGIAAAYLTWDKFKK